MNLDSFVSIGTFCITLGLVTFFTDTPIDPLTLAGLGAILFLVGAISTFITARRKE